MIKFENTEVFGWEHAIRGMWNPMNSWEKSDSGYCHRDFLRDCTTCVHGPFDNCWRKGYDIGPQDYDLMKRLRNAGTDHRKFMRMITVYVDITAPLYWWKEFNFYYTKNGVNDFLCLDKIIKEKNFTLDDFSHDQLIKPDSRLYFDTLDAIIYTLNVARDLYIEESDDLYLQQIIQLLPTSYNLKRTVIMDYDVLAKVYSSYKKSKLKEWRDFIDWIDALPYSEEIIKSNKKKGENN